MKLLLYVNDSMNASLIYPSTFYRDILTYKTSPVQRLSFFFPPRIQYCRRWLGGTWKPGGLSFGQLASVGRESLGPREGPVEDICGVYSKPALVWTPECARAIKELLFLSHHPVF